MRAGPRLGRRHREASRHTGSSRGRGVGRPLPRRPGRWLAVVALLGGLGGCGLPHSGEATTVPASNVPYGLVTPTTTTTSASGDVAGVRGTVYLVNAQQLVVPLPVDIPNAPLRPLLQDLLNRLSTGPTDHERARGLLTDLGPGSTLVLRAVSGGTATVELQALQDPSAGRYPVAIAQVVLTATSVIGVDRVRFVQADGTTVNVPAPAGDLTSSPLTAATSAPLLAPKVTAPPRMQPLPGNDPVPSPRTSTSTS